jgi:hypothetical protein
LLCQKDINFKHRKNWEEGIQTVLKVIGIEWKGVRAVAQDRERWKAVCKPCTATGGDLTK